MWLAENFLDPQMYSKGFVNNKTFFDRKLTCIDRVSQLSTGGQHVRIKDFFFSGGGGGVHSQRPENSLDNVFVFTQHNIYVYNELK